VYRFCSVLHSHGILENSNPTFNSSDINDRFKRAAVPLFLTKQRLVEAFATPSLQMLSLNPPSLKSKTVRSTQLPLSTEFISENRARYAKRLSSAKLFWLAWASMGSTNAIRHYGSISSCPNMHSVFLNATRTLCTELNSLKPKMVHKNVLFRRKSVIYDSS
jgi:hypothetical protein